MPEVDKMLGLYTKYEVSIKPGSLLEGEVVIGHCDIFVLDLTHDRYAIPALKEWQRSWEAANPGKTAPYEQDYLVVRLARRTDTNPHKHKYCEYFVLNASIDPHSLPAIRKYTDLCRVEYPGLAADLGQVIRRNCFVKKENPELPQEERPTEGSSD